MRAILGVNSFIFRQSQMNEQFIFEYNTHIYTQVQVYNQKIIILFNGVQRNYIFVAYYSLYYDTLFV